MLTTVVLILLRNWTPNFKFSFSFLAIQDITHTCQEKLEDLIHSFSEPSEAELYKEDHEECGHEVPFDDTAEHRDEEEHKHCRRDFIFSSLGEPVKMKAAEITQDTIGLETGLRQRVRNE